MMSLQYQEQFFVVSKIIFCLRQMQDSWKEAFEKVQSYTLNEEERPNYQDICCSTVFQEGVKIPLNIPNQNIIFRDYQKGMKILCENALPAALNSKFGAVILIGVNNQKEVLGHMFSAREEDDIHDIINQIWNLIEPKEKGKEARKIVSFVPVKNEKEFSNMKRKVIRITVIPYPGIAYYLKQYPENYQQLEQRQLQSKMKYKFMIENARAQIIPVVREDIYQLIQKKYKETDKSVDPHYKIPHLSPKKTNDLEVPYPKFSTNLLVQSQNGQEIQKHLKEKFNLDEQDFFSGIPFQSVQKKKNCFWFISLNRPKQQVQPFMKQLKEYYEGQAVYPSLVLKIIIQTHSQLLVPFQRKIDKEDIFYKFLDLKDSIYAFLVIALGYNVRLAFVSEFGSQIQS